MKRRRRVIQETKGGKFRAKIRKLAFAASIYFVWQEQNWRIFKHAARDWRAKRDFDSRALCKEGNINDTVVLV